LTNQRGSFVLPLTSKNHPEQLASEDIKPRHFGDVMSTGKLFSPNVYFQIEMEN
jgi:hypothetical protein